MMPTSSGAHWGREKNKKDVCPEAYPLLQVSPAPAGARFPGCSLASPDHPAAAQSPPNSSSWSLARLTCEKQTPEQRARQDRGVPAADHGERDAACWPGARARAGPLLLLLGAARALLRACSRGGWWWG